MAVFETTYKYEKTGPGLSSYPSRPMKPPRLSVSLETKRDTESELIVMTTTRKRTRALPIYIRSKH